MRKGYIYFIYGLLIFVIASCSVTQRAKRLLRQGYAKIEKAKLLDPSVVDSVKGTKDVEINLPGSSASVDVKPEIDTTEFQRALSNYDSIKAVNDDLKNSRRSDSLTSLEYEEYVYKLKKANDALRKSQERLSRGFSKDSTYVYDDSLQHVEVTQKGGLVTSIKPTVKPRVAKAKVDTIDIKLDAAPAAWKQEWFWIMAGLNILLVLLIIVLSRRR